MSSKKLALLLLVLTFLVTIFVVIFGILGDSSNGGSPKNSFISVAANVIFWKIISFGFLFSAIAFMWEKIINFIDSRNKKIKDDIDLAEKNRISSENLLFENQKILNDSVKKADLILEESRFQANKIKDQIIKEAKIQSDILIKNSMQEIESYRNELVEKLKNEAANLSVYIASKIMSKSLKSSDHNKIIDDVISKYKISF